MTNLESFIRKIYNILYADNDLRQVINGVYTSAPLEAKYPYIQIDDITSKKHYSIDSHVEKLMTRVYIIDAGGSGLRCHHIMSYAQNALAEWRWGSEDDGQGGARDSAGGADMGMREVMYSRPQITATSVERRNNTSMSEPYWVGEMIVQIEVCSFI